MTEQLDKKIKSNAAPQGLILGVIVTILGILSFYIMIWLTGQVTLILALPFLLGIVIPFAILIFFTFQLRKKIGGFWGFRQAVTGVFIMLLVAFAVQYVVRDLIFANVIEPHMVEKTENAMITSVTAALEKSNVKQEDIDKKMADIQKGFNEQKNVTIGYRLKGIAVSLILMFVIALILAAFFKKEGHVFNPNIEAE
ncbi:MAG: DUF4199 domain-containing protein [Bacteroidota bacterium]